MAKEIHPRLAGLTTRLTDAMRSRGYKLERTRRGNLRRDGELTRFCDRAGVQMSVVSGILAGEIPPNIAAVTLIKIADALGVPVGMLCAGEYPEPATAPRTQRTREAEHVIRHRDPVGSPAAPAPAKRRGAR